MSAPCALRVPRCLAAHHVEQCLPPTTRPLLAVRPECRYYKRFRWGRQFCNHSVYATDSGVLATLPIISDTELAALYDGAFSHFEGGSGGHFNVEKAETLSQQSFSWLTARLATSVPHFNHQQNFLERAELSVVEMGCMHGALLSRFNSSVSARTLRCFEATPQYHKQLVQRFEGLTNLMAPAGGRAELVRGLFNGASLSKGSVDLFLSTHVRQPISARSLDLATVPHYACRPSPCLLTKRHRAPGRLSSTSQIRALGYGTR